MTLDDRAVQHNDQHVNERHHISAAFQALFVLGSWTHLSAVFMRAVRAVGAGPPHLVGFVASLFRPGGVLGPKVGGSNSELIEYVAAACQAQRFPERPRW